jgi:hypothetical protein
MMPKARTVKSSESATNTSAVCPDDGIRTDRFPHGANPGFSFFGFGGRQQMFVRSLFNQSVAGLGITWPVWVILELFNHLHCNLRLASKKAFSEQHLAHELLFFNSTFAFF